MDKRYILVLVSGLFLCISFGVQGQRSASVAPRGQQSAYQGDRVRYETHYMKRVGDSLVIDMDIDMTQLNIGTNFEQILTPVIGSDDEEIELPKVRIQGASRNKAYVRQLELNDLVYEEFMTNPPYDIVKARGRLNYHWSVPYETWMDGAYFEVEEDLCGCDNETKIARTRLFDGLTKEVVAQPKYNVKPQLVYIQPEVEPVKNRREVGNAYLEYPRGKNEILPNFGNNPRELAKIDKMIRDISINRDVSVQGVFMTGYASPESSLGFNTELSRARAESMMRYFMSNSDLPGDLFNTRTGGEDWDGLVALIEEYPLSNKNEIMRIINTVVDLDQREKMISKVGGGQPYKIIYDELYPKLRRVVCEVDYTVRDFSLEEAKENLATAPQLLSLNEMYIVANTYPVGSNEFLKVFEVAREEFPDDPVANFNGAAAALSKGNLREAEKYLKLADSSTPEYANNYGVFLMLKGDYQQAERYLKQAEASGIAAATANLRELRKKVSNVKNRREAGVDEDDGGAAKERTQQQPPSATQRRRR